MATVPPPSQQPSSGKWYLAAASIIGIAAIAASFLIVSGARGNADYICTYIIEEHGACTSGSWSDWSVATTTAQTCSMTTTERRVYTGTRTTRHILQYLNLRTACDAGYTQTSGGDGDGDSGFHGGTIVSESTACQIEETRTARTPAPGPGCGSSSATSTTVTSATIDLGNPQSQQSSVTAIPELTAFRERMIAGDISAVPSLVRTGATTLVRWQGREVTECTVTGTNGDSWEGTAGEKTSGLIEEQTTYMLTCTAFNGTTVTDSVTVQVAPIFEE